MPENATAMLDGARAAALHSTLCRLESIPLDPGFFSRRKKLGWSRAETNRAIKALIESDRAVAVADGETVVLRALESAGGSAFDGD